MVPPRFPFAGQSIPAYAKTVGRSVHVRIYPRPRNLAESREVLRVLQQYGEVVMYKRLKYEPLPNAGNTALAIYQTTNAAQSIINASPLHFESGRADSSSSVSQFAPSTPPSAEKEEDSGPATQDESDDYAQEEFNEVNNARERPNVVPGGGATFTGLSGTTRWGSMRPSPSSDETATSPSPTKPAKTFTPNPVPLTAPSTDLPDPPSSTRQTSTPSSTPREFHLIIEQSILNHHLYIQRQHYYGRFNLNLRTVMGDDLRERVPVTAMADCQLGKGEVPLRIRLKRRQEHEEDKRGWNMSLRSLWEEGERAREKARERKASEDADTGLRTEGRLIRKLKSSPPR